jgi:hypothetical protein
VPFPLVRLKVGTQQAAVVYQRHWLAEDSWNGTSLVFERASRENVYDVPGRRLRSETVRRYRILTDRTWCNVIRFALLAL